jgi:hypothetical protein
VKRVLAIAVVALAAGALWWHSSPQQQPHVASAPVSKDETRELPVASVLRVRPSASPTMAAPTTPATRVSTESPRMRQFRDGVDYASLYRSLDGDTSPEALYLQAEIYAKCANHGDESEQARAEERQRFVAALARDANAAKRIDAFDRMHRDPCQGLDLGGFDAKELMRMVGAAADAGDARARAWQMAERIEGEYYAKQRVDRSSSGYRVTAADFDEARRLLASGEPGVIEDLQGVLSSSLERGIVQLDGQPVDQAAMNSALTLLACAAGANCGPDAPSLLRDCTYRGRCAAGTVSEYMFYYESSPAQAQLIDRYYRELLAMMNARDFSGLTLADVERVPGFSMTFGGRRVLWDAPPQTADQGPPPKLAGK